MTKASRDLDFAWGERSILSFFRLMPIRVLSMTILNAFWESNLTFCVNWYQQNKCSFTQRSQPFFLFLEPDGSDARERPANPLEERQDEEVYQQTQKVHEVGRWPNSSWVRYYACFDRYYLPSSYPKYWSTDQRLTVELDWSLPLGRLCKIISPSALWAEGLFTWKLPQGQTNLWERVSFETFPGFKKMAGSVTIRMFEQDA